MLQVGSSHDASFIRGDANDDGDVNIVDPLFLLFHLFGTGASPYCADAADAADANDSGSVDVADAIVTLQGAFLGADWIAPPFPQSGFDATVDELACYEPSESR